MKNTMYKSMRTGIGGFTFRIVCALALVLCIIPLMGCEQTEQPEQPNRTEVPSGESDEHNKNDGTAPEGEKGGDQLAVNETTNYGAFDQFLTEDETGKMLKTKLVSGVSGNISTQDAYDKPYSIAFDIEKGSTLVYTITFSEDSNVTREDIEEAANDSTTQEDNATIIQSFEDASGVKGIIIAYRYYDSKKNSICSVFYNRDGKLG